MALKYQFLRQAVELGNNQVGDGTMFVFQVWDTVTQYRKEFSVGAKLATVDAETALKDLVSQDLAKNPVKDLA